MASNLSPEMVKEFVIASHFDLPKVQAMLKDEPALLTVVHDWGESGLEDGIGAAAHVGNRKIAEFFLAQGVPLNICVAAMLGRAEDVKAFLELDPALANARGAHGIPVMFHAAMSGNTEVADLLRQHGCNEGYSAALHGAIAHRHKNMVAWLLDNGATELEALDFQGKTPLQQATETNQADIADLLRQHGATK
jgi:ankyrin repeat protein